MSVDLQTSTDAFIDALKRRERRNRKIWVGAAVVILLLGLAEPLGSYLARGQRVVIDVDLLIYLAAGAAVVVLAAVGSRLRKSQEARRAREAFGFDIDCAALRANPARLAVLRERTREVCLVQALSANRRNTNMVLLVENGGEVFEVERVDDLEQAREVARWLAQSLNKPLVDSST
jgi:hypothetical protein